MSKIILSYLSHTILAASKNSSMPFSLMILATNKNLIGNLLFGYSQNSNFSRFTPEPATKTCLFPPNLFFSKNSILYLFWKMTVSIFLKAILYKSFTIFLTTTREDSSAPSPVILAIVLIPNNLQTREP